MVTTVGKKTLKTRRRRTAEKKNVGFLTAKIEQQKLQGACTSKLTAKKKISKNNKFGMMYGFNTQFHHSDLKMGKITKTKQEITERFLQTIKTDSRVRVWQ